MENIPFLIGVSYITGGDRQISEPSTVFLSKILSRVSTLETVRSATVGGRRDGEASALLALALTTAEPKVALGGINAILGGMMHQEFKPCSGVDYKRILFFFFSWEVAGRI